MRLCKMVFARLRSCLLHPTMRHSNSPHYAFCTRMCCCLLLRSTKYKLAMVLHSYKRVFSSMTLLLRSAIWHLEFGIRLIDFSANHQLKHHNVCVCSHIIVAIVRHEARACFHTRLQQITPELASILEPNELRPIRLPS